MCGASGEQEQIGAAQRQMYNTLNTNYQSAFSQQQNVLGALTRTFQPILQAGPYQTGYSPVQAAGLNAAAGEDVAQQYASAARTLGAQQRAAGGDTFLPTSINANQQAALQASAAQARANAINANMRQNYAQGYQNWTGAANALSGVAQQLNPTNYASAATSAGTAAANTANQIAAQSNSLWNSAIGAIGGIGGMAIGNLFSPSTAGIGSTLTRENPWSVSPIIQNYQSNQAAINAMATPTIAGNLMPGSIPNLGASTGWQGTPWV